jgi:hypothetical protein
MFFAGARVSHALIIAFIFCSLVFGLLGHSLRSFLRTSGKNAAVPARNVDVPLWHYTIPCRIPRFQPRKTDAPHRNLRMRIRNARR